MFVYVCVHGCMFRAGQPSQTMRLPTLEVISHRESRSGAALCNVSAHVGAHVCTSICVCNVAFGIIALLSVGMFCEQRKIFQGCNCLNEN